MITKERGDQISGGVFLIGLALLFMNVLPWWPGIMFVIGASVIARGVAEGQPWYTVSGGMWMIGLGIIFWVGFSLPMLLILIGVTMLFGYNAKSGWFCSQKSEEKAKRKNDEQNEHSAYV
ncbi:MAG: hypothetical protein H6672_00955 [Anaerolineaceae bacterium]|nr:hypothetical protein [Anaerolineaceae bacterium]